ncbi:MAG: hypothetical protein IJV71_06260 [Lachnospiraceae bacterium]|nr:hypothetical protein [Lachnospiraceae bacterium]
MKNNAGRDLVMLLLGIGMFGAGLVLFFMNVRVWTVNYSFWGVMGGFNATGVLFIPIILGIILWIMFPKSIWPKLLTWVGVIAMVLCIISSLRFGMNGNAFTILVYVVLIFGGGALTLKKLYIDGPRKNDTTDENK